MSSVRGALAYVGVERSATARLIARAVPDWTVVHCDTHGSALETVRRHAIRLIACEACDAAGERTEGLLRVVAANYASIGTVAIVSRSKTDGPALVGLVNAGAHALLLSDDRLTPLECRQVLTHASIRAGVRTATARLLSLVDSPARLLLDYCLANAHRDISVADVAAALRVHRKTLFWWCQEANLPAPQKIVGWCRLLAVAALLDDQGRRVDHIAMDLDFPSGTALRNLLHRYTGLSPARLRAEGAVGGIARRFTDSLENPAGER